MLGVNKFVYSWKRVLHYFKEVVNVRKLEEKRQFEIPRIRFSWRKHSYQSFNWEWHVLFSKQYTHQCVIFLGNHRLKLMPKKVYFVKLSTHFAIFLWNHFLYMRWLDAHAMNFLFEHWFKIMITVVHTHSGSHPDQFIMCIWVLLKTGLFNPMTRKILNSNRKLLNVSIQTPVITGTKR